MKLYILFKRYFDFILSIFFLIIFFPIIIIIPVCILFVDLQNPFFIQRRTGYKKKLFNLYKFKTMKKNKITRLGSFLRRTRLDELPQLLNILKNDMSFVGPRPLLEEYLDIYDDYQLKRFNAPQGITCISQISGGNKLTWEKKLNLDVEYVDNRSFLLDIKILILTFVMVLRSIFDKNTDANIVIKFMKKEKNEK